MERLTENELPYSKNLRTVKIPLNFHPLIKPALTLAIKPYMSPTIKAIQADVFIALSANKPEVDISMQREYDHPAVVFVNFTPLVWCIDMGVYFPGIVTMFYLVWKHLR